MLQLFRRRRQNTRKSVPLTEEMLHELNKNHMGGVDNLGNDAFYDVGDAWDPPTFPSKPVKVTWRCAYLTIWAVYLSL